MIHKDIYHIFTLIANDKYVRVSAFVITSLTIAIAIFFSPLAGLIIYGCYIMGYIVCWCLIKYQSNTSAYLLGFINYIFSHNTEKKFLRHSCSVCDDLTCKRHQQTKGVTPWKYLKIPKELDSAVEKFYNRILDNFINSWYCEFTKDTDFVNELRYCLRYASATIINRFMELDHAKIIATKLLPYAIKHIDDYLYMQQLVKLKNFRFNDVIVEYLGKRLHVATANRKNEFNYLQNISMALIPHLLPDKYLKCRNYSVLMREIVAGWVLLPLMDVLADPNSINLLTIVAINYKYKKTSKHREIGKNVEFLHEFIKGVGQKSSFATDLNTIKKDNDLLYSFMQFLKHEEHVHLLQFCLEVEDFNNKLLNPDLTKEDLEELHSKALVLYKDYLNKNAINYVGCSKEIVDEFYSLIKEGVYNVGKLRTSTPLFQAYEYTFTMLETEWLPSFFHSNEFYKYICGSKITADYNKEYINRMKKYYENANPGAVARISSGLGRIKGALRANQPIEGAIYPVSEAQIENGTVDGIIISECGSIFRDLSAWRISILSYQTTNKIVSFCINVQRLDAVDDCNKHQWLVLRKDQDFYTLKAKLVEFHGENEICNSPFPPRKNDVPIDVRMAKYEDFLKNLLQKPSLRGSDLLHSFLTAERDFTLLISSAQNVQDIGNIYQSVAHKLRKEKGQHLLPFMSTFLTSTGKSKTKIEWGELGDELDVKSNPQERPLPFPKTYRNQVFNDNFGITYKIQKENCSSSFNAVGVIQCLFYLLKYVFNVPYYVLRLFAAICSIGHEAVESFSKHLIERKLKSGLSPSNLAYLIALLEDVVFNHHASPSKNELEERKKKAFKELENILPGYFEKIMGENFNCGCKLLLEILQHPHYNKQLIYNLFDLVFLEMYPSLGGSNKDA